MGRMVVRGPGIGGAAVLVAALAVAGCNTVEPQAQLTRPLPNPQLTAMSGARPDERFALPATDIAAVDPRYFRQGVAYPRSEAPGTRVVDPGHNAAGAGWRAGRRRRLTPRPRRPSHAHISLPLRGREKRSASAVSKFARCRRR